MFSTHLKTINTLVEKTDAFFIIRNMQLCLGCFPCVRGLSVSEFLRVMVIRVFPLRAGVVGQAVYFACIKMPPLHGGYRGQWLEAAGFSPSRGIVNS